VSIAVAVCASVVAAVLHGYIFVLESLMFSRAGTQQMFEVAAADAPAVRLWAFHQGIYNLLLGATALAGAAAAAAGATTAGLTLMTAAGIFMVLAAVALVAADPRRARLPGFLAQAGPSAATLLAVILT
jgi:putative membrane protein